MRIELIAVPVSNVDRAIDFYQNKLGFNLDHDHKVNEQLRFVQLTPPGSACSIAIGTGVQEKMKPGTMHGIQVVVDDIEATKSMMDKNGVEHEGIQDFDWGRFIFFSDPDGNSWSVQQIPKKN